MNKTITFRMRMRDYRAIRHIFHGHRGETAAEYFSRLKVWLWEMYKDE